MFDLKNKSLISGFSLIELLFVITIIFLITIVVMPKLIDFQREQSIKNTAENIIVLLNKAKSNSNSSLNSSNYGVHFSNDNMIYFTGETFIENNPTNEIFAFESGVEIPTTGGINLNGGGSNIIFPRLTGDVIGYGTITIQLTAKPERQKIITITKTGSISSN